VHFLKLAQVKIRRRRQRKILTMTTTDDVSATGSAQRPKRKLWRRIAVWSLAVIAVALLGIFGRIEMIAHRPSPVHATLTKEEIAAEDAYLKQLGLVVRDGSFLKEHPFEAPWTSHSLLVPSGWLNEPPVRSVWSSHHVRADLLLSDLDVLEPVMERAYGGWDNAAAHGWNWNQWFENWRKELAAKGRTEISFDEAFAPVRTLNAFQRDNHTQIPLNYDSLDPSQTAVLASDPGAPCSEIRTSKQIFPISANDAGQQVHRAKLWKHGTQNFADANYISVPISYGMPQAVHCGQNWIPLQIAGTRARARQWSFFAGGAMDAFNYGPTRIERIGDGIIYARLPTFNWQNYEGVSQQGWAQRQPGDRLLIVDMRGNGGGDAGYGLWILKNWIDEKRVVPWENIGTQITSSCIYAPLTWNREMQSHNHLLQKLIDQMAEPYPSGCPRTVETNPAKWTYLQHHFNPRVGDMRIIALVDSGCASDCEWMTEMLASLPETIVAPANQ
jgi:hypothetical protein